MYALFEYKGKQYKAEKGAQIKVDLLDAEKDTKLDVAEVLLVSDGTDIKIGAPYVAGSKVKLVVEESGRDKKIIVQKYKSKKDYRRLYGHRQGYTMVRVEDIVNA